MSAEAWLKDWLGTTDASADIFDEALVDSLGVVELILSIEEEFDFTFDASDYQDRRFRTVEGLSKIVEERRE